MSDRETVMEYLLMKNKEEVIADYETLEKEERSVG